MKVAMVTPYWYPVRGGVTTYVAELSEALRKGLSLDVRVIAREGGALGATVLGGTGREFVRRAAAELERISPDVVHAHGHWYALQAALKYRRHRPGTRIVFTLHTMSPAPSLPTRLVLRRMYSKADAMTAVSHDLLARAVRTHRPRTRARVVHPGVALRRVPPEDVATFLRSHDLEGRGPLIVFVGPLAYEAKSRGVRDLVAAMRSIREKHPGATLLVAGDGPFRADLEAFAAREVPGGVVFLGCVDDPFVVLAAASAYAHISHQEGLPLAVLEAMACGTPVVASPVGGIPEVVRDGENGLLVGGEPKAIADCILGLLGQPPLAKRLAAAAAEHAATRLPWSRSAGRFAELYGIPTCKRVVVTVDLEEDYGAPAPSFNGVEEALPKLLSLFEAHGVKATVFATADLCGRFGDRLREVVRRGHDLGCHGFAHDVRYLGTKPFEWQLDTIRRATTALEDCMGFRPRGFRAPNFSANGDTIRALEQSGYAFDSSVLPGRVVRLRRVRKVVDFLVAPRDPYRPSRDDAAVPGDAKLVEVPVTENPFSPGGPIGLGYVNAYGPEKALEAVARSAGSPCVFLIHSWELCEPPPGRVPSWMRGGCGSDSAKLGSFLARVRKEHEFTTFARELGASGLV